MRLPSVPSMACVMLLFCALPMSAQQKQAKQSSPKPPAIERITDSLYRIGRVMVDMKARTVTCPGVVNMNRGPVEYLAVGPGGKLHESVLRIDARPIYVQLGLILLNLEPHCLIKAQGDAGPVGGPPLRITVKWKTISGKEETHSAEDLVLIRGKVWPHNTADSKPGAWSFTGSQITRLSGFSADAERSLVAVWNDPVAVVNNRELHGGDNSHEASAIVPPVGTSVELVMQPL